MPAKITEKPKGKPTKRRAKAKGRRPTKEEVLESLGREHRAMNRVLRGFQEQLQILEDGGSPNYRLMYEILRYLNEFPGESHHPREDILFSRLAERDEQSHSDVERTFVEHDSLHQKAKSLLDQLDRIQEGETELSRKSLLFRSQDYVTIFKKHIDRENGRILPRAAEILSDQDWKAVLSDLQHFHDPKRYRHFIEQYQKLQENFTEQLEEVTEEFTLLEFFGLGAMVESVGILSNTALEIQSALSENVGKSFRRNLTAYKGLLSAKKRKKRDYVSVPFDCMLDTLDAYSEALTRVSHILRKTRSEINEPYASRIELFHEIEDEHAQRSRQKQTH